jgi:hypothetical protein
MPLETVDAGKLRAQMKELSDKAESLRRLL